MTDNVHRSGLRWYDLDHQPIDMMAGARLLEDHAARRVDWDLVDSVREPGGPVEVSTVFLVLDHNYAQGGGGGPLLYETLVFAVGLGGERGEVLWGERWARRDQAAAGHREVVAWLTGTGPAPHWWL